MDAIIKEVRESLKEIKAALVGTVNGDQRGLLERVRDLETVVKQICKSKEEHDARVKLFFIKVASSVIGGSGIITLLVNILIKG